MFIPGEKVAHLARKAIRVFVMNGIHRRLGGKTLEDRFASILLLLPVSWGPDRLDLFAVDHDLNLLSKTFNGSNWYPSKTGWENLGGSIRINSSPAPVSWGPDRLDVFAVKSDKKLYHKTLEGRELSVQEQVGNNGSGLIYQWYPSKTGWVDLGVELLSNTSPAPVALEYRRIGIIVLQGDRRLYYKELDKNKDPIEMEWKKLGNQKFLGSPAAVSWGPDRLDVFAVGIDSQIYHKWWYHEWLPRGEDFEKYTTDAVAGYSY